MNPSDPPKDPTPLEAAASTEGGWLDAFLDLRASGLPWRKAAFAAWANAPKTTRQPRTMRELADLLNLKSEQVFYKWQQAPWFRETGIDKLRQLIFQRHIGDVDRKTIAEAITESGSPGVAARRLFYEQARLAAEGITIDLPADSNFERALNRAYGSDGVDENDDSQPNP